MYFSKSALYLLGAAASVQALSFSDVSSAVKRDINGLSSSLSTLFKRDSCPPVWSDVTSELKGWFLDGSQCSDDARAAIRLSFHDCFSGGCDGSIILAQEYLRGDNAGLAAFAQKLAPLAEKYNVGTADLIQVAGALATATCPLGPRIAVRVGRKDSSTPSAEGQLPSAESDAGTLIAQFAAKGFSATDLAALVGAHSTAKQFFDQPDKAGESMDTTPGVWDTKFYSQTQLGTAPVSLQSDKNLAKDARTAVQWTSFTAQGVWAGAYVSAMNKMTVLGNDAGSLTDCSSVVAAAGTSKRDIRAAGIAERIM